MNKILEILEYFRAEQMTYDNTPFTLSELDEAIAELEEAMKPKTCEGCKHGIFGIDRFGLEIECLLAYRCSRGQDDRYEPKETV